MGICTIPCIQDRSSYIGTNTILVVLIRVNECSWNHNIKMNFIPRNKRDHISCYDLLLITLAELF